MLSIDERICAPNDSQQTTKNNELFGEKYVINTWDGHFILFKNIL